VNGSLDVIRRIRAGASIPRPQPGEVCELCGEMIAAEHGHLVDLERRTLMCSCRGCYLLFTSDGAGGQRFRSVPDRYRSMPGMQLTAAQWDALQIPVSVAFFFVNSTIGQVAAFYPSPAGATESLLPLTAWDELVAEQPELGTLLADVEGLIVRVDRETHRCECFIVPIDACYELVGQLRLLWKGFDGGSEARRAMDDFFTRLGSRAGAP
jgi:Family of unknown function (DUF5947)